VCPAMTYQQRIIGCVSCMLLGFFLSLGSLFRLVALIEGDPVPFAMMYSLGNIIGISSSCFLYGPWTQLKQMFAFTRIVTTTIYLVMLGVTLFLVSLSADFSALILVFSGIVS
jgi:hypothetical protein